MDQAERILQQYGHYRGCQPQRIDHFNLFARDVQASIEFYAVARLPPHRVRRERRARAEDRRRLDAPQGRRARYRLTNGSGPRLHHIAYWVPTALNIIHLCDLMASTGYLANMERGPGRHGISNAFFLYVRDPDGHRTELYTSDYLTVDPDFEPIRWSLRDPRRQTLWGTPAPRSWFEEGSIFPGTPVQPPVHDFKPIVAD